MFKPEPLTIIDELINKSSNSYLNEELKRVRRYTQQYYDSMMIRGEEVDRLLEENKKLREALKFYATKETYHHDKWGSPIERDSGDEAKKALGIK